MEDIAARIEQEVRALAGEVSAEATAVLRAQQRVLIAADALMAQRGGRTSGTRVLSAAMAGIAREAPGLPPERVADALDDLADSIEDATRSVTGNGGVLGVRVQPGRETPDGPVVAVRCMIEFRERAGAYL